MIVRVEGEHADHLTTVVVHQHSQKTLQAFPLHLDVTIEKFYLNWQRHIYYLRSCSSVRNISRLQLTDSCC